MATPRTVREWMLVQEVLDEFVAQLASDAISNSVAKGDGAIISLVEIHERVDRFREMYSLRLPTEEAVKIRPPLPQR